MERIKKARKILRDLLQRTLTETEAALEADPLDKADLHDKKIKLDDLLERTCGYDQRIFEQMLEIDGNEDELAVEVNENQGYLDRVRQINSRIEANLYEDTSDGTHNHAPNSDPNGGDKKKSFRLPKIELRKFGGLLTDWIAFWSQFSTIHDDQELHAADKFHYLVQAMEPGSRAMEVVSSYPPSGENYIKAIEALKERFGREDLLVEVYVRELLRLVINNCISSQGKPRVSTFFDRIEAHLRALETLGVTRKKYAAMLFPLVESGLPEDTLRAWQRSTLARDDNNGRLSNLMEFLRREVDSEERIKLARQGFGLNPEKKQQRKTFQREESDVPTAAGLFNGDVSKCIFCEGNHQSRDCGKAQNLTLAERKKKVEARRCCYSCLRPGHTSKKCKTFIKCPVCNRKHPVLLCPDLDKQQESKKPATINHQEISREVSGAMNSLICNSNVVLQTLRINVFGNIHSKVVRALVDTGSQRSYILESTAKEIGLDSKGQTPIIHSLFGGRTTAQTSHNQYQVEMEGLFSTGRKKLQLLGQDTICGRIPRPRRVQLSLGDLHNHGIQLTDVGEGTPEVEILLGADACGVIMTGRGHQLEDTMVAVETTLGWTIMGALTDKQDNSNYAMHIVSMTITDSPWEKLWSLEALGIRDSADRETKEEEDARVKAKFMQSYRRNPDGRYVVRLPWKDNNMEIVVNYDMALRRLQSSTKKLDSQGRYAEYQKIFYDWLAEGIIEEVTIDKNTEKMYYLPHRPVFKPQSLTTPVRPVFDASCKSHNNLSLNDLLETGPNMLELIPTILLRFRQRRIGFTSDIRKAFLMIELDEQDRDVVRFLWWNNDRTDVIVYRHSRVVFGLNCSPFLLAATLETHLRDVQPDDKEVAEKLLESMYVDNCVASVDTMDEYEKFKSSSIRIMQEAKMELRQWEESAGEGTRVGSATNGECGLGTSSWHPQGSSPTNIFGLIWDKMRDTLRIVVTMNEEIVEVTKRSILSQTARIFDPIGMVCPALLIAKKILQQSWAAKLGWDDLLPETERQQYMVWIQELPLLAEIEIPRWGFKGYKEASRIECHVFSDASISAYAAAIFVRLQVGDEVAVHLLSAKSRLAPMKGLTIPRLELMGCLIAVRLYQSVVSSLENLEFHETFFWSDSSTALAWIRGSEIWKTFVRNRAQEIRSKSDFRSWRHIPGESNPADLPSRGCLPSKLKSSFWWEGPGWLRSSRKNWPSSGDNINYEEVNQELRKTTEVVNASIALSSQSSVWKLLKFASYWSNLKVIAWILRFYWNSRHRKEERHHGTLTVEELNNAELRLFRSVQVESFGSQYGDEYVNGILVIYDEMGTIRVQTKLLQKEDTTSFKQPVLLPKNHPLVESLIRWEHSQLGHAGVQIVMGKLREKVWILQGRKYIKTIISRCEVCKRYAAKRIAVPPAPLPVPRISSDLPFACTGVDLAGPLFIKDGSKAWIVIYTCATFRCVHFELVNSLSTEAFLLSLSKFISRRGRPAIVYSDNGTNFVGAVNAFKSLDWKRICREAEVKQIQWRFNPPSAAWWGGFWERLIRSAKDLLRRMLGHKKLTYFQLESCVVEVEAIMNNRPLTYISEDQSDLVALTPAMFLRPLQSCEFPEAEVLDAGDLREKYRTLKHLRDELKSRFRREYLALLIHRGKTSKKVTVTVGEIVLIEVENMKRILWPLGKVIELIPGKDGVHRVARLKTANGILLRPLQRLFPLEISSPKDLPNPPAAEEILPATQEDPNETLKTRYGRIVKKPNRY